MGIESGFGQVVAHGFVGGIMAELQGGKFGHGFAAAGLTKAATVSGMVNTGSYSGDVIVAAVVGGTASVMTGGKFANGAVTAAFAAVVSQAAQSAKPQRLSSDGEYVKGTVEEISAQEAQKQFDALKADLVEAGVEGAEKLQFVNKYARDLAGHTATNENYSFMSQEELFGNQLGGSVAGELVNGVPTL